MASSLPLELVLITHGQLETIRLLNQLSQQDFEALDGVEWDGIDDDELDEALLLSGLSLHDLLKQYNTTFLIQKLVSTGHKERGPYNIDFPKSFAYFEAALGWPPDLFRHEISRTTFDKLVEVLERNPIFQSRGRKPQRAVRYQLATFLLRYASRGSDTLSVAKRMGIGVGTVWLYCRRVTRALRELGLEVITWGDEDRHRETADHVCERTGFPDCIGMIDCTLIRLTDVPSMWGEVYYCRKKYPAVNVQGVCDHKLRFISFEMGWPGSTPDVTVLKNSDLWRNRTKYFTGDQYLFADRGYQSSPYLLRPFTEPEVDAFAGPERRRRLDFNRTLSGTRIYIEHAFGLLKGRFHSLKDLGRHRNVNEIYQVIHALMVLHNLCIDWEDSPHDFIDPDVLEEMTEDEGEPVEVITFGEVHYGDGHIAPYETDEWHKEEGRMKRDEMLNRRFPLSAYV
ncbi:hypothetical protein CC1G_11885 [Coprinopsis cinerea okayama7|uniref:DDE Tnp4 domain-containing protein n=1 Tax=Coprinopsis cinerea (strain Okayama-7 / 130 / ATCC MYA-4618 / FGSC 9003) TaxID=240176 RepID=A8P3J5_COPC7|nr:hypothetical protein CC1G_11885 [Coprinopsis cinerea okayama7\|eukprot:XP_001838556.2 hypothetical protein CC1G_11885 [Coprinopsis cinerea okayama7\